jgi:hypothetical protein
MIALTIFSVEESRDPHVRRIDFAGALAFSSALFLVTLALIESNHDGWSSRTIQLEFVSTVALFLLFAVAESTQERPMLDLTIFRNPTYLGANIAFLAFASCLLTMLTYLPIYFQSGLAQTPQAAGLHMLPMVLFRCLSCRASLLLTCRIGSPVESSWLSDLRWLVGVCSGWAWKLPRLTILQCLGGC